MKRIFIVIFILSLLNSFALSQSDKTKENKPAIFVKAECKEEKGIRFRLFNNTNWVISVPTVSFYLIPKKIRRSTLLNGTTVYLMPNDIEISSLFYTTEKEQTSGKEKSLLLRGVGGHDYNNSWIGSKDSIRFSIPKEELKDSTEVYITFNYEWELSERGFFFPNEVQHRAYFRFPDYNNPQKLLSCAKS